MKKLVYWLTITEYVFLGIATLFVLLFQFIGLGIFVTLSLLIYTLAFLMIFTIAVIQCKEYFDASRGVEVITNKKQAKDGEEVVNIKKEKAWAIVKAVCSGLFAIFTFVVFLLY